jgi:hypothetical protein
MMQRMKENVEVLSAPVTRSVCKISAEKPKCIFLIHEGNIKEIPIKDS